MFRGLLRICKPVQVRTWKTRFTYLHSSDLRADNRPQHPLGLQDSCHAKKYLLVYHDLSNTVASMEI